MADNSLLSSPLQTQIQAATQSSAQSAQETDRLHNVVRRLKDGSPPDDKTIRKTCQDFEAIFISKLWQQMRDTVPKEGYLHNKQEDFYLSMFDQELSRKLAGSGGIGLGDMLYKKLKEQLKHETKATPQQVRALNEGDRAVPLATPQVQAQVQALARSLARAPGANMPLNNGGQTPGNQLAQAAPQPGVQAVPQAAPQGGPQAGQSSAPELMRRVEDLARQIVRSEEQPASAPQGIPGRDEALGQPVQPAAQRTSFLLPNLQWPVHGRTVASFGLRGAMPGVESSVSSGIEIATQDKHVSTCMAGRVSFVGHRPELGLVVEVEHPCGMRSIYGGLDKAQVKVGEQLEAGKEIATMQTSEGSAGRRLYFEVRQGDVALNPELLMGGPRLV